MKTPDVNFIVPFYVKTKPIGTSDIQQHALFCGRNASNFRITQVPYVNKISVAKLYGFYVSHQYQDPRWLSCNFQACLSSDPGSIPTLEISRILDIDDKN